MIYYYDHKAYVTDDQSSRWDASMIFEKRSSMLSDINNSQQWIR